METTNEAQEFLKKCKKVKRVIELPYKAYRINKSIVDELGYELFYHESEDKYFVIHKSYL